jgi:cephalosporin hydroxylase
MTAEIVSLATHTLQDVPNVLRAIADQMEAGEYGEVQLGAVVVEDAIGNVRCLGLGGADYYRAIAMFHMGIENLMTKRGREHML